MEDAALYAALAFAWSAYFVLHSILASLSAKRVAAERFPGFMPYYRLTYNLIATLLLLPLLYVTLADPGPWLWQWTGAAAWAANGLALLAAAGFLWTLRYYSGAAFLGLSQWRQRERSVEDSEGFRLSPLHRHVRHPWYLLGLILLWTRDMDPLRLTAAVTATAYLVIGSRLEERKLVAYHGDAYRDYRRQVPGIVPRPWRRISARDADRLTARARRR